MGEVDSILRSDDLGTLRVVAVPIASALEQEPSTMTTLLATGYDNELQVNATF